MSATFAELGIPFPLFAAPSGESADYPGIGRCGLCGVEGVHCFKVDDFIAKCPDCKTEIAIRNEHVKCQSCNHDVPSPGSIGEVLISCYKCLRAGRAAFVHDTTLGMVKWDHACEGLTHGVPGLKSDSFELVPWDDNAEWMRARVAPRILMELVRTPSYVTWQGEHWQFCCGAPMIYVGEWKEKDFKRNAPDLDGRAFFQNAVIEGVDDSFWGILQNIGGPYMFRCSTCRSLRGHYDMD